MSRLALSSQPYQGKSLIASGQECVNLYGEINQKPSPGDPQAPVAVTWYPTAGSVLYADPNFLKRARGAYRTSKDTAYYVVGQNVYFLANNKVLVLIGTIADRESQVYFSDNGQVVVLVDGLNGYAIDINNNTFGVINSPNFLGADYVLFLDTFFAFNRPATNQFYISFSNVSFAQLTGATGFDPLDIAAKAGFSDAIVGIATVHRELWLIGELTTEIWIGTGAADFFFQEVQGAFINHGCAAQYSIATQDVAVFYLMQDQQGVGIVVKGVGYDLTEISTPRIVSEFKSYATLSDAIGFCFQIEDHSFYAIVFPTANKGWLYDLGNGFWVEWNWLNADDGSLNRPRANCCMFAYNANLIGDWENGKLYELKINVYTDFDGPIVRIKTFSHILDDDYSRVSHKNFDADMECGTTEDLDADPQVLLSWSDDRGRTYGVAITQSLGMTGRYLETVSWNRLGMARDRVYKLQWSAPIKTACNGGFVETVKART